MKKKRFLIAIIIVFLFFVIFKMTLGNNKEHQDNNLSEVTIWFHGGTSHETEAMKIQVKRFNNYQDKYTAVITEIPGGSIASGSGYNDAVNAAAVAGNLPDILDLDGPNLYNYAWAEFILPLDNLIDRSIIEDLLPSLIKQGTYKNKLYAIGQYDSGLALAGRRSFLNKANVRIPQSIDDSWSKEEFLQALESLKNLNETEYVLDMKLNYGAGEWFTYGFSPILQGFGADLIDRSTFQTAENKLNGPEALAGVNFIKDLFTKGYVNPTPIDDNDFISGRVALGFCGHWMTKPYREAFGDDFILIPMPVWDKKAVTGMGSWAWSITSQAKNPEGAASFLEFIMKPEEILSITDINGAVPGRNTAFDISEPHKPGGPLNIFIQQLEKGIAVTRPETPAFPTITTAFSRAIDNIIKGADPQKELDAAVDIIDKDIKDNYGYK